MEDQLLVEVEHYRMIPKDLREFLESNPDNMFKLGNRLKEALKAKEKLAELERLSERTKCSECNSRHNCIINELLKNKQIT
jgi:hypothetical protein